MADFRWILIKIDDFLGFSWKKTLLFDDFIIFFSCFFLFFTKKRAKKSIKIKELDFHFLASNFTLAYYFFFMFFVKKRSFLGLFWPFSSLFDPFLDFLKKVVKWPLFLTAWTPLFLDFSTLLTTFFATFHTF